VFDSKLAHRGPTGNVNFMPVARLGPVAGDSIPLANFLSVLLGEFQARSGD